MSLFQGKERVLQTKKQNKYLSSQQAGWLDDDGQPTLVPETAKEVLLYTLNGTVRVRPMRLICQSHVCSKVWNGEKEKILRFVTSIGRHA